LQLGKNSPNRKNALFYKTLNGAGVGDLFMSLIHTCELNGANPFDYLTELLRHSAELQQRPSAWMPWNYRETLARIARPQPRNMMDPAWPKRIDRGRAEWSSPNPMKRASEKGKSEHVFGQRRREPRN
jgi:hypothetical protein